MTDLLSYSQKKEARGLEYTPGAILRINRRMVGLYKSPLPEHGYHLLLVPGPEGTIDTRRIKLDKYECEQLGVIEAQWFHKIQEINRWDRDVIVFHCNSMIDVLKLPTVMRDQPDPNHGQAPQGPPAENQSPPSRPEPAAPQPAHFEPKRQHPPHTAHAHHPAGVAHHAPRVCSIQELQRGHRFQITMGGKAWYAVYWGKDDDGFVIAHHMEGDWSLIHLDIEQYASTLRVLADPETALIGAIELSLKRHYEFS